MKDRQGARMTRKTMMKVDEKSCKGCKGRSKGRQFAAEANDDDAGPATRQQQDARMTRKTRKTQMDIALEDGGPQRLLQAAAEKPVAMQVVDIPKNLGENNPRNRDARSRFGYLTGNASKSVPSGHGAVGRTVKAKAKEAAKAKNPKETKPGETKGLRVEVTLSGEGTGRTTQRRAAYVEVVDRSADKNRRDYCGSISETRCAEYKEVANAVAAEMRQLVNAGRAPQNKEGSVELFKKLLAKRFTNTPGAAMKRPGAAMKRPAAAFPGVLKRPACSQE